MNQNIDHDVHLNMEVNEESFNYYPPTANEPEPVELRPSIEELPTASMEVEQKPDLKITPNYSPNFQPIKPKVLNVDFKPQATFQPQTVASNVEVKQEPSYAKVDVNSTVRSIVSKATMTVVDGFKWRREVPCFMCGINDAGKRKYFGNHPEFFSKHVKTVHPEVQDPLMYWPHKLALEGPLKQRPNPYKLPAVIENSRRNYYMEMTKKKVETITAEEKKKLKLVPCILCDPLPFFSHEKVYVAHMLKTHPGAISLWPYLA